VKRKLLHPDLGTIEGYIVKQSLFFSYIELTEPVYIATPGEAELYVQGELLASKFLQYSITKCFQIGDILKIPIYSVTSLELVKI